MSLFVEPMPLKLKQPQATIDLLRTRILEGQYNAGEALPAERYLTEELSVHRRIIRAALLRLEKEGLLLRRPNCRPVVQIARGHGLASDVHFPASRLVAFVMYHESTIERADTAQQKMFWGMNQALSRAGYHSVFLDLGENIRTPEQKFSFEAHHLRYAMDQGFGGVVFYAYAFNKNRDLIREVARRMPLVLIDRMLAGVDVDFVGMQNEQSMREAVKFLIELGHRRIAYLSTSDPINTVQDRLQGYLSAMRKSPADPYYEMVLPIPASGDSFPLFDATFTQPAEHRPTALVCLNDYEAQQAAWRLIELGLSIPGDVSIIGCDNVVETLPGGAGLTTIAQPFEEIGKEAARLFLQRVDDPDLPPSYIELPTRLIIRDSAKPPASVSAPAGPPLQ